MRVFLLLFFTLLNRNRLGALTKLIASVYMKFMYNYNVVNSWCLEEKLAMIILLLVYFIWAPYWLDF